MMRLCLALFVIAGLMVAPGVMSSGAEDQDALPDWRGQPGGIPNDRFRGGGDATDRLGRRARLNAKQTTSPQRCTNVWNRCFTSVGAPMSKSRPCTP
jgi:hypothetical protein